MRAKTVMVQGTASHVGKSVIVAALCRLYARAGYRVAPFKAQNMSNNSWVTREGGEIGRAQAFQAQAAGVEPHVDMNPILLKPDADTRAQVVLLGQPVSAMQVREYHDYQTIAWEAVTGAFDRLCSEYELLVLEGAGSPAEINLRDRDIVNMKMAKYAHAPVLLIGDIERGGVFASLVGTLDLLLPDEREMVQGLLINKFRGDPTLLDPGLAFLENRTGLPVMGVLPYVFGIPVDEEDAVVLDRPTDLKPDKPIDIGIIRLPHISNATDFQPLVQEPDVSVRYIKSVNEFGKPDVVILPGTKSTVADFEWLSAHGLSTCIRTYNNNGGWLIGICGGYQMLGRRIYDPENVESAQRETAGLSILPVSTTFKDRKRLLRVSAECQLVGMEGLQVRGYEIHQGRTQADTETPFAFQLTHEFDRAVSRPDGAGSGPECFGTYIHGLFDHIDFRRGYLNAVRHAKGLDPLPIHAFDTRPKDFDQLADWLQDGIDIRTLEQIVGLPLER